MSTLGFLDIGIKWNWQKGANLKIESHVTLNLNFYRIILYALSVSNTTCCNIEWKMQPKYLFSIWWVSNNLIQFLLTATFFIERKCQISASIMEKNCQLFSKLMIIWHLQKVIQKRKDTNGVFIVLWWSQKYYWCKKMH